MLLKSVICLCIWVCGLHSPWSSQNFSIPSVHSSVNVLGVLLLVAGRGQSDCLWLVEKIMEMGYKWYLDYSWVHKSSMIGFFMLFYDETHFLSPHPHLLLLLLSLSLSHFLFFGWRDGMSMILFTPGQYQDFMAVSDCTNQILGFHLLLPSFAQIQHSSRN